MAIPSRIENVIIGAGIHGLSAAWQLAKKYIEQNIPVEGKIAILDKTGLAAGASGIACGVIRNNYFHLSSHHLVNNVPPPLPDQFHNFEQNSKLIENFLF